MAFAPALPATGLAGYRFLQRTYARQTEAFNQSPDVRREVDYFLQEAGKITSLDALMADRRVLSVVLGAYGLEEDLDKRAFIRRIIGDGTLEPDAFANRLVEPAYRDMASALGFGDLGGLLVFETTREDIANRYLERRFELAVGEQDLDLRLALTFRREAPAIAGSTQGDRAGWLRLIGSPPLRSVVETALGLPSQFAQIDLDQQIGEISRRANDLLGISSPSDFADDGVLEKVIDRFLLLSQASAAQTTAVRGSTALGLLQASGVGTAARQNLFASAFV